MTNEEKRLIEFAKNVLRILRNDDEWTSETMDSIGMLAIDLGLGKAGANGLFEIVSLENGK